MTAIAASLVSQGRPARPAPDVRMVVLEFKDCHLRPVSQRAFGGVDLPARVRLRIGEPFVGAARPVPRLRDQGTGREKILATVALDGGSETLPDQLRNHRERPTVGPVLFQTGPGRRQQSDHGRGRSCGGVNGQLERGAGRNNENIAPF
jgi:hypothetical protein